MIPSPGRIVAYTLTDHDVDQINRRRLDAQNNRAVGQTGFILHNGNAVISGQVFPMMITRVWGNDENTSVNGQVHLDGNDCLWVTSVTQGQTPGQFQEFPRV